MYQCKCSLHENLRWTLEALRIGLDAIFWSKVLCSSENYNSECWKGECDECTNGKNIPFPGILSNEDVTYKEWGQNNHNQLTLHTKEFQVGELKEKLPEGLNN